MEKILATLVTQVMRVVALWLSSISPCIRITCEYTHLWGAEIESLADLCGKLGDCRPTGTFDVGGHFQ